MTRLLVLFLALSCAAPPARSQGSSEAAPDRPLTLKEIMAHPHWIHREPEQPYWSDDSTAVYYQQERLEQELRDTYRVDLASGAVERVPDEELSAIDVRGGELDRSRTRKVWARNGDLFVKELGTGAVRQLTRTAVRETAPRFLGDSDRVAFMRGGTVLVRELDTGLEHEPAELVFEDDPDAEEEDEDERPYLERQQERLLEIVRLREEREERAEERQDELEAADDTVLVPWYLGDGRERAGVSLSPDGRWLLLRTREEANGEQPRDRMPEWVTEDSFVETREVRAHVGYADRRGVSLHLLDLAQRERTDVDVSGLPLVNDRPLAWLEAEEDASGTSDEEPSPRPFDVWSAKWAPDSESVAFLARSLDNKDRWIGRVDAATGELGLIHHLHDEAWIGWRFNEYDWLDDASGLWFTSEETGYSQLYLWDAVTGATRALTEGEYEVDAVEASPDGAWLYFRANVHHPGVFEIWRVALAGGAPEQLTDLGGRIVGDLSPDGRRLLLTHSKALSPPELWVQDARPGAEPRQLTSTVTDEWRSRPWVAPRFVEVPSRRGGVIHARLYLPRETRGPRPAVAFVHGAGYLQNAHKGWSSYFREFMFHSLLAQEGYVVIDADYRASAGYGRDWRTAIYRRMGTPELEDYEDCVQWLVDNHGVDPERVGVYGGSYGGFLTLMALFEQPDLFACGAALRPVTDWAHYNHPYTSNILNTPELDPEAYERSSPIELADGLSKPLLFCHGMLDDNVLAKDSIRLAQRLIELEKEDWEMALYPVEPHSFREPSSWLDEYRRIFALFERHLR